MVQDGGGGTSPLGGVRYSGSVQRRGTPAHRGQWGTQSPQSWEVNISYVCSACLMLTNSRATLWSCIGCFHTFSTRKPAALHTDNVLWLLKLNCPIVLFHRQTPWMGSIYSLQRIISFHLCVCVCVVCVCVFVCWKSLISISPWGNTSEEPSSFME